MRTAEKIVSVRARRSGDNARKVSGGGGRAAGNNGHIKIDMIFVAPQRFAGQTAPISPMKTFPFCQIDAINVNNIPDLLLSHMNNSTLSAGKESSVGRKQTAAVCVAFK